MLEVKREAEDWSKDDRHYDEWQGSSWGNITNQQQDCGSPEYSDL